MRQLGREVGLSVGLAEEIFLMIYLIYRKTVPIKWQVVGSEDLAYRWSATASMSAFDFRKDASQSPSSREVTRLASSSVSPVAIAAAIVATISGMRLVGRPSSTLPRLLTLRFIVFVASFQTTPSIEKIKRALARSSEWRISRGQSGNLETFG
jgi:hypothetical protein